MNRANGPRTYAIRVDGENGAHVQIDQGQSTSVDGGDTITSPAPFDDFDHGRCASDYNDDD